MRRRTFSILIFLVCLFPVAGCNMNSAERIAAIETTVTTLQEESAKAGGIVDGIQTFLANSHALLAEPNLPADEVDKIAAAIVAAQAKLIAAQAGKAKVDTVLGQWQTELAKAEVEGPGDELALLAKGITTVGAQLPPPFGAYAALAGGLITAAAGAYTGIRKANTANAKTTEAKGQLVKVIGSVDSLLDSPMIDDANIEEAKKLLAKRQGITTATAVKALKET